MEVPPLPVHLELEKVLPGGRSFLVRDQRVQLTAVLRRCAGDHPRLTARLKDLVRLSPRSVIPEVELVQLDGAWFSLRCFVAGEALADFARRPSSVAEKRALFADVCRAVAAMHADGVVHGRLHARNIIADQAGLPVIVDCLDGASPRTDGSDETVRYASPEQLLGKAPTTKTDLYALAVVAVELFTGRHPYADNRWTDVVRRVLYEDVRLTGAPWNELPSSAVAAIERALSTRPHKRPADATDIAKAFDDPSATLVRAPPLPDTRASPPLTTQSRRLFIRSRAAVTNTKTQVIGAVSEGVRRWRAAPRIRSIVIPAAVIGALAVTTWAIVALRAGKLEAEVEAALAAKQLNRARAIISAALRDRKPEDPLLLKLRGDIACTAGEPELCLSHYDKALEQAPGLGANHRLRQNTLALLHHRGQQRWLVARVAARLEDVDEDLLMRTSERHYWKRWNAVRALEARGAAEHVPYAKVYALDVVHAATCDTRRAALRKLVELKDQSVLPLLETAKRSADRRFVGDFCLGDELASAIRRIESPDSL